MPVPPRFILARVVGPVEFAGEADIAGPRQNRGQRQIRRHLAKARRLKRRIAHLRIRKPLGWKRAVRRKKTELRVVMSDLKLLGWKPRKPPRAPKPGEDEMDAALDDIPELEPGEQEEELEPEPEEEPVAEGNWLDDQLGAEGAWRRLRQRTARPLGSGWGPAVPLNDAARVQTRAGQRAMVATVSPGLYIVQIVSDAAAAKAVGDNLGALPMVLFPLVKNRVLQKLAAPPAQPAPAPAPPAATPAAAGLGCDACRLRS